MFFFAFIMLKHFFDYSALTHLTDADCEVPGVSHTVLIDMR